MSAEGRPRRLTLGVMGHVDHGKTALVGALTGMDTDRLPEEKRRGLSIALGFAHAGIDGVEVDFIDMPGHERFVRTLVSGATGVDAALLVVAVNEGVKPQTQEHLDIAALLEIGRVLPVLSKADLATPADLAELAEKLVQACKARGVDALAPVSVSARDGRGMDRLRAAIGRLAAATPRACDDGFPWLPLDRAFTRAGHGTVATGTLRRGRLERGASLTLYPGGRPVRLRDLQVHGRPAQGAEPGRRVAVNLRDLEPGDAPRGTALAPPGALEAACRLTVALRTLPGAAPLRTGARLVLLVGAAETPARLRLLEADVLPPGAAALAQLETDAPVATPAGERFVVRVPSPAMTVAGGEVIDPAAPRLRRCDPVVAARLHALRDAPRRDRPMHLLGEAAARGVPLRRLASIAGQSTESLLARLDALGALRVDDEVAVAAAAMAALCERLLAILQDSLAEHPRGVTRRTLTLLAPEATTPVLDGALRRLAEEGRIRLDGTLVRLPLPRRQAQAEAELALALARTLADRLRCAALTPPDLADLAPTPDTRRILDALVKAGVAVRTLDRVQKRELAFHREAIARACVTLAPHLTPPGLTVGEAGAALGLSRKFSVPLLEYLDAVRFTRRLGDRRVLGPAGPPC